MKCAYRLKSLCTAIIICALVMVSEPEASGEPASIGGQATFADDLAFLRQHTDVIVLSDAVGKAQLAVVPCWQGRVMTSSAEGLQGSSFGWINRQLISEGKPLPHFNPWGGEDRLWLGPEGGQFSIYFAPGAPFDLDHWYVPKAFDTVPFRVVEVRKDHVSFGARFQLTNYSGTHFDVAIQREVRVLDSNAIWKGLGLQSTQGISVVGYESHNTLINAGSDSWRKQSGLLSIWILGMFNPSPSSTIVIPVRSGAESKLGKLVTADYFGAIPPERLHITPHEIFLRADGQFRSKVGVNPKRSRGRLGAYDASHRVLTIVQFDQPEDVTDYVNSLWKVQDSPFAGDALNSYNDGPPAPGKPPLGPFFELESSSPAAALAPGQHLSHTHRTLHLTGSESALDPVARATLGVSLAEIKSVFGGESTQSASTSRPIRSPKSVR